MDARKINQRSVRKKAGITIPLQIQNHLQFPAKRDGSSSIINASSYLATQ